jgi:pyruvate dehydrogenase E2 component (dihydrolipoamide acetyltransferase)
MSRYEFKLPDIGEGVTEGEIVEWHVKPGDLVQEDQPLVEVMTDKATVTITSPKKGRIAELFGNKGAVVKVHSTLVVYDLGGAEAPAPTAAPAPAKKDEGPAATAVGDIKDVLPGMGGFVATVAPGAKAPAGNVVSMDAFRAPVAAVVDEYQAPNGKTLATPATRKLARDLGVDLKRVRPSGASGRVTKDDVRQFVARGQQAQAVATMPAPTAALEQAPAARAVAPSRAPVAIPSMPGAKGEPLEERVPFRGLRRKIAEKMQTSKNTAAHFTFVEEVDCTALKALRERLKDKAAEQGVKLTYLPFITKAVVAALKKHPILNSALDESTDELVYRKYYNIGIAAATDAGLIVPVVKQADRRSLLDLAREIDRLGTNARNGKSAVEDLQGSTFTITSLGAQGGLFATPIINFPEVAILGVHQMKQKPVVRDGQIVIGDVMLLSLSFDHRIIDGHVGAAFAYEIIGYLQDPDKLMLEL